MSSNTSKVLSLSLAKGVLMLVNVVSGMIFARTLSLSDYGTYLQTFLAYDFAVPLLTLGLPSALFYFLPAEKERKKGLILDNLLLMFLLGIIFSLFLYLGGTELLAKRFNNPNLTQTLYWMLFYPLYTFPVLIASAVWVTEDKVKLNAKYNVITGIVLSLSLICAAIFTKSYLIPTLVRILLPLAFFPFALYFIFKDMPGNWNLPSLSSMWSMAKFSIPLGIASVFGTLTLQVSNVIVSMLTTTSEYAIYANGAKQVPFIGIITGSISVVLIAEMTKSIKGGDYKNALQLFRKSASYSASLLFPIMVFLMIFADSFINILYSFKYANSVEPFRFFLLLIPLRIVYYGAAFIAFGKTRDVLYRSLIELLITCFFSYLFVKYMGSNGAALGLILTMFFWSIPFNLISLSKQFNCNPFDVLPLYKLSRIGLISIVSAIVPSFLFCFELSSFVELVLGLICYSLIYVTLSIIYNSEVRKLVLIFHKKYVGLLIRN